jgi:excinuclease UvrABC nuclease subunit
LVKVEQMSLRLEGFTDLTPILRSGIYALCKRGVVIYVGKSKSLYARIYAHKNLSSRGKGKTAPDWMPQSLKGIAFDQVFIQPCRLEDLVAFEEAAINRYKPHYNINLKNTRKVSIPSLTLGGVQLSIASPAAPRIGLRR